jgi:hypothetical protein
MKLCKNIVRVFEKEKYVGTPRAKNNYTIFKS